MIKVTDNVYTCDEGKVFISKDTGIIYGNAIDLCEDDSIDNYSEVLEVKFDEMFS